MGDGHATSLLTDDAVDRADLIGIGTTAQIRRLGRLVVKVAHPIPACRDRVRDELARLTRYGRRGGPLPVVLAARDDGTAFVRRAFPGQSLADRIRTSADPQATAELFAPQVVALSQRLRPIEEADGVVLDVTPANLFVDRGALRLVDGGARLVPPIVHAGASVVEVGAALLAASRARDVLERAIHPLVVPPSQRLHVDVPVGPVAGARLVWRSVSVGEAIGLAGLSRAELTRLMNWSTMASPTTTRPATRYRDSPGPEETAARGDGRVISLGAIRQDDPARRAELSLKGCGPTALAWTGHAFHEDGRVSFPRTLWEVTIGELLTSLGFEAVRVLGVITTGASTLDNTGERWPATAACRVARTHWRVGHLCLDETPLGPRTRAAAAEAGRALYGGRFDVDAHRWRSRLVDGCAQTYGFDLGRAYGLQIVGFHPTLGNVRLDGHPLDYSTVRAFRYHLPTFRYLDNTLIVRDTRAAARPVIQSLARAMACDVAGALVSFGGAFAAGVVAGADMFFGLGLGRLSVDARTRLAKRLTLVWDERGEGTYDTGFFQQRPRAPLFDLAGNAPAFLEAIARDRDVVEAALSPFADEVSPRARHSLVGLAAALRSVLDQATARPRSWSSVIPAWCEATTLAQTLYGRASLDDDAAEWQAMLASFHTPAAVVASDRRAHRLSSSPSRPSAGSGRDRTKRSSSL